MTVRSLAVLVSLLGLVPALQAEEGAPGAGAVKAAPREVRAVARELMERHADAVVTVRLVLKRRMVFQGREQGSADVQMEIGGTVLTPAGLTVVSDSASNPSGSQSSGDTRIETDTSDVKIVLRDGREVPARFVLRDADLDLAFILPEEKGLTLAAVDLSPAAVPQVLDPLVFLYRLGKSLSREIAVGVSDVRTVIHRPRTFLVADMVTGLLALGCPVFDASGHPVGIVVMRRSPLTAGPPSGMREMLDAMTPVVITAADLADLVAQAQKAPAVEKK